MCHFCGKKTDAKLKCGHFRCEQCSEMLRAHSVVEQFGRSGNIESAVPIDDYCAECKCANEKWEEWDEAEAEEMEAKIAEAKGKDWKRLERTV